MILKELRKSRNLTQTKLCKRFNVTQKTLSSWESGTRQPNIETLINIADYFQVSLDELLGRKEKTNITDIKLTDYQQEIYNLLPFLNQIQCQAIKSMIDAFNVEPEVEDKEIFDLIKKHGDK